MFIDPGLGIWVTKKLSQAANKEKPRFVNGEWQYRGSRGYRYLLTFGVVMFTALTFVSWRMHEPLWETAALGVISLLPFIGFPPVLAITERGVERRTWRGRNKVIFWGEITALEFDAARNNFAVISGDGSWIEHTGTNVALRDFMARLLARTKLTSCHRF